MSRDKERLAGSDWSDIGTEFRQLHVAVRKSYDELAPGRPSQALHTSCMSFPFDFQATSEENSYFEAHSTPDSRQHRQDLDAIGQLDFGAL